MEGHSKHELCSSVISQNHHPPAWADRLLTFFCRPDYSDEILGDLHEAFYWRAEESSIGKAKRAFVWEVIKSLRPKNLKSFYKISINTMVFRNYIKVAFRSLLKRRSTSFINIMGLSLGTAAFLIIFLYAYQILTFDDFHDNKERIFLTYKERITPDGTQATYDTWVPLKDRLLQDYSQVQAAARFYQTDARIIKNNEYLEEEITYTDESFFDIFSYPLLHGNSDKIFNDRSSIVLGVDLAIKYFQSENPIGETLEIFIPEEDTTLNFQVSAVLDRFPENISLQPTMIIQSESIPFYLEVANEWDGSFLETYVLLDQKESVSDLEAAFPDLIETIWGKETRNNTNFKLLPYEEYYDTFLGNKSDARTLLLIGIGILLIASINFMNLSTAQASQRMKEIGLRKVLGAFRSQVSVQFLTEAFVTSVFAMALSIIIVMIALPHFNDYFDVQLSLTQFELVEIVLFCIGLATLLGFVSGSYPALYLSSIKSIDAFRQKMGIGGSMSLRNALVVFQFSIALFLIASAIFVKNQIGFMVNKDMGFDADGTLILAASRSDFEDREQGLERLNTLKTELGKKSYVNNITMSRSVPTAWTRSFTFVRPDGWDGDPLRMRYTFVDANFFDAYEIGMKHGNNFLNDGEGDQRSSVILNEAAMNAFKFNPNEQNAIKLGDRKVNVVGVVEDFHFESLQNEVAPTLIFHRTASNPVHRFISLKMNMTNLPEKIKELETMWDALGSTNEFSYYFLDENIQELYEAEERYLGMVTLFSGLSIIVACLGLYGLTLFIIEKRRKEISIRKVLGAEVSKILQLIFVDFTKWVLIGFFISVPAVIYFVSDWLEAYFYRIEISWITFALTFILVLGLVIITVGYQSLKAAVANPVSYLKEE